jgi:energy-coupling factor transport system permease protein
MAERLIFHYHHRDTFLNRVDPRIKLFTLLVLTIIIFQAAFIMTIPVILLLAAAAIAGRMPINRYKREMIFFFFFSSVIFLTRWWADGDIFSAAAAAVKFLTVVAGGLILTDSTSPEQISLAIFWLVAPLGRRRAHEFAAKFSLTISFIPMLFDAASDISEARRARQDHRLKRPLRRMISMGSQMMDHILERAEDISYALESRCFTPYVLHDELSWRLSDTVILLLTVIYLSGSIVLRFLFF